MKKLFALTLLLGAPLVALPAQNPATPIFFESELFFDASNFRFGFWGNYVFQRELNFADATINSNALFLALNLYEKIDLFATVGVAKLELQRGSEEFWFSSDVSWSIGAKVVLYRFRSLLFGLEAEYFGTKPNFNSWIQENKFKLSANHLETKYDEWQVALGAAYAFAQGFGPFSFSPFAALLYSSARLKGFSTFSEMQVNMDTFEVTFVDQLQLNDLSSRRHWGAAVGLTANYCRLAALTVEGRFLAEYAFSVIGEIRF